MEIKIDEKFIIEAMEKIINVPSPVGYYEEIEELLKKYLSNLGLTTFYDERHTAYVKFEGQDPSRTVLVSAHIDTIGLWVQHIEPDGSIKVRNLGLVNFHSIENEKMYIKTRNGCTYTGYLVCVSHSMHVFKDALTLERTEENMRFMLDADVSTDAQVRALGIRNGDIIAIEPHFERMENGRIRSRFIDNKGSVAAALGAIKYIKENNLKPRYNTLFAFTCYEERGGDGYVPAEVKEYVALDVGVMGPEHNCTEKDVSIVATDANLPYDRDLTWRLIQKADKINIKYTVEVFKYYSTDSMAAFKAGNNLKAAAFGMTAYSSHGIERTFESSIFNTTKLTVAYVLDL